MFLEITKYQLLKKLLKVNFVSFGYNFPDIPNSFLETPWLWSMGSLLQWLGVTLELLCLLITHIASSSCINWTLWSSDFKSDFLLVEQKDQISESLLQWVKWGVRLFQSVLVWIIAILYKWGKDSLSCKLWYRIDTKKEKTIHLWSFQKNRSSPLLFPLSWGCAVEMEAHVSVNTSSYKCSFITECKLSFWYWTFCMNWMWI